MGGIRKLDGQRSRRRECKKNRWNGKTRKNGRNRNMYKCRRDGKIRMNINLKGI